MSFAPLTRHASSSGRDFFYGYSHSLFFRFRRVEQTDRPPGVRRVTFTPYIRHIYTEGIRMTFGFWTTMRPRPSLDCLVCGSCASDRSFASSFLPTHPRGVSFFRHGSTCFPVVVRSCCSARSSRHLGLQRTFTSKSLPGSLSLPGYPAPFPALRAMPGAHGSPPPRGRRTWASAGTTNVGLRGDDRTIKGRNGHGSPPARGRRTCACVGTTEVCLRGDDDCFPQKSTRRYLGGQ
jgi:hypothetical protein